MLEGLEIITEEMYEEMEEAERQKHFDKLRELQTQTEHTTKKPEKKTVEACKICDNNCGYCRFACNCSTEVEI